MNRVVCVSALVALAGTMALIPDCEALPVNSGNELASRFQRAKTEAKRNELQKESVDHLFFFRYLKVVKKDPVEGTRYFSFETVEPSSDAVVTFVVKKKESLKLVENIQPGEGMAVTGCVRTIGSSDPVKITLDPVVVRYKDHLAPKPGRELLGEVDPSAKQ